MQNNIKNNDKLHNNHCKKRLKYDTHRMQRNTCKTVGQWAERLNLNNSTIRGWLKRGELKAIDNKNPPLIHAGDIRACLIRKNENRKIIVESGEIFCFTCAASRVALRDSVNMGYNKQNRPVIRATCSICSGKLFRISNENNIYEKMEEIKNSSHRVRQLSCATNHHKSNHYHEEDFVVQYNAVSERIKFKYFDYLKEAKGFSDKSLKTIEASILRCERLLNFPNLIDFDKEMAKKLKKKIKAQELSLDTACASLHNFKNFMQWLKEQTGYKAKLNYCDIEYLTITRNDKNSLGYKRFVRYPSINQVIESVINMPINTQKQKRDQAIITLIALTGVRDGVIPHLRLKHLDMREKFLIIEPKEVPVKCGNYHVANFLVQDKRLLDIIQDYTTTLISKYSFCNNDPLFPKIAHHRENDAFATGNYSLEFMRDSQIVVRVCKDALKHLPNSELYSPHTIRHTLISLGKEVTQNPKELKAWSQSIGHSNTTHMMDTYGQIDPISQVDIINNIRSRYVPPQDCVM